VRGGCGACRGYYGYSLAAASLREEKAGRRGLLSGGKGQPGQCTGPSRGWDVPCAESGRRQVLVFLFLQVLPQGVEGRQAFWVAALLGPEVSRLRDALEPTPKRRILARVWLGECKDENVMGVTEECSVFCAVKLGGSLRSIPSLWPWRWWRSTGTGW